MKDKHRHSIHSLHRSPSHRRRSKRKKTRILCIVSSILILFFVLMVLRQIQVSQQKYQITAGNSVNMGSGYRTITYEGKNYRYNNRITTILYAGLDSSGPIHQKYGINRAPRSDSISLAVLDEKRQRMTVLSLTRDTITPIRHYNRDGKDLGMRDTFLAYGFSGGDGGELSISALKEAVSHLLYGIPVNEYIITNRSSLQKINDFVGGVTVTVPNQDLAAVNPAFAKGAAATLDENNIEEYLRYRNTDEDFSNSGRLERQQSYIIAYVEKLKQLLRTDLNGTWKRTEELKECTLTDITQNQYLDLCNLLLKIDFSNSSFYSPEGRSVKGEEHDEFYVDEDALLKKVIEIFYEEI